MWRGRYQLGEDAVLSLLTVNASGTPTWPDAAPIVQVWDETGVQVYSGSVPVTDRYGVTGLFQAKVFLGGPFAVGRYRADFTYLLSGDAFTSSQTFEVVAGGDAAGAVQSLTWFHQPHGEFVVQQLSGGSVQRGRNPRV